MTWEERVEADGRRIFIITISDIVNYHGTRHTTVGGDKMLKGLSKGLNIFKELTNNTCEWMRAQQVRIALIYNLFTPYDSNTNELGYVG